MIEVKEKEKIIEEISDTEKVNLDAYAVGTICLLENDIGREAPDSSGNIEILKSGSPVKIIGCDKVILLDEIDDACEDVSITLEDHRGERWYIEDIHASSLDLLFTRLERVDIDWLLSDKGYRHYKHAECTDNNSLSGFAGLYKLALAIAFGMVAIAYSDVEFSLPVLGSLSAVLGVWGLVELVIERKVSKRPLSSSEMVFFRNYTETKAELEALIANKK